MKVIELSSVVVVGFMDEDVATAYRHRLQGLSKPCRFVDCHMSVAP